VFLGEVVDYVVSIGAREWRVRGRSERSFSLQQRVALYVRPAHCLALPDDLTAAAP